jgi:hypothetical protein
MEAFKPGLHRLPFPSRVGLFERLESTKLRLPLFYQVMDGHFFDGRLHGLGANPGMGSVVLCRLKMGARGAAAYWAALGRAS